MKISEVRELTQKERVERLAELQKQYTQLKIQHSVSPLDNPSQIKDMRKDIARLETILEENELNKEK